MILPDPGPYFLLLKRPEQVSRTTTNILATSRDDSYSQHHEQHSWDRWMSYIFYPLSPVSVGLSMPDLLRGLYWRPLLRARCRRLPIKMPVVIPEVFKFRQFSVTISQTHVNRPGQFLTGSNFAWRTGSTATTVPCDGATSNRISGHSEGNAGVKVTARMVGFQGPEIHPVCIQKDRGLRRFLNACLCRKQEFVPGVVRVGKMHVRIKPAVICITAKEHRFRIRCPPDPSLVRGALPVSTGRSRFP